MNFLVMHPGGEFSELQTDRFGSSLAVMQYAVDGYIEPVTAYLKQALQLDKGIDVFVNENGLRKGLPSSFLYIIRNIPYIRMAACT